MNFELISKYKPSGDQPKAIRELVAGVKAGLKNQTLLGVTGSGKTFTVANVIQQIQKPTLVIAHNKTLAAQLCNEFRELFPHNAVHYFVSYYDYYQPEAYMPTSDTYIGKEAMINDEIDKLRHAATTALLTRKDVIIVASVSCIYGLGAPEQYAENIIHFKVGQNITRKELTSQLIKMQFNRTSADLKRGTFRLRGDNWEIMPPSEEIIYNLVLKNNLIEKIYAIDPVKGFNSSTPAVSEVYISPARHFITGGNQKEIALINIEKEMKQQLKMFEDKKMFLEAERLERRTKADMAMMREIGYCNGIENYSRHLSGRNAGEAPDTLLDYFPSKHGLKPDLTRTKTGQNQRINNSLSDWLLVVDESHVTMPQIGGMYEGDASRKKTLIEFGFRLPSASDNRPLKFEEFKERMPETIYTSATPGTYELKNSREAAEKLRRSAKSGGTESRPRSVGIVEQIIRPTGLIDPKITILPAKGQIENLLPRIRDRVEKGDRVLVTTLTKKMAEDLSAYMEELKIKVNYLHSDVKTLDRIRILTSLRRGDFDVLIGVNLLREGLDLPEVSLIAILDADKEGFLRSETSLIQTIGRAARNVNGEVLMYADVITGSIERAVRETDRRRKLQVAYNTKHNITPQTIKKDITDILPELTKKILSLEVGPLPKSEKAMKELLKTKEREMKEAANNLDFELAAILRDEIRVLKVEHRIL